MPLWPLGLQIVTGRMPKTVKPSTHVVLDCAIAGSFLLMAARFWQRNRRAAIASLICGGASAANMMLTDYPAGALDVISYRTHGRIDGGAGSPCSTIRAPAPITRRATARSSWRCPESIA
jgi:hypothetical protein